tara:strand:- start:2890 stop:3309 length:420 start_codon:yes stop_codon:yes gene_type:complete
MNDAPERIWLLPFDGEQRCWCDDPDPGGYGHDEDATGYVRVDLVDALRAHLATAEAEADALELAAQSHAKRGFAAGAERDALRAKVDALVELVELYADEISVYRLMKNQPRLIDRARSVAAPAQEALVHIRAFSEGEPS